MPEMIENSMVVDWHWREIEYGVPEKRFSEDEEIYGYREDENGE